MTASQIIVLATPVFIALIAAEWAYGAWREKRGTGCNTYRVDDAISSVSLGMLSQVSAVFTRLLRVGIYVAVYHAWVLVPPAAGKAFWGSVGGWVLALVFYDLCYYWHHRLGHRVAVLWAAHVVHHQSQSYNLSTALRQTSSGALLGWIFYVPMALAGVPPVIFGTVALVDLLYQFWVHTEQIKRLGWFDRWFCSPSNHRVHHAVNDDYVDKNYGGILMVWDHLFGSFKDEDAAHPCVYGTRSPLRSWDPLWANAEVYGALAMDSWRAERWIDKAKVWLMPPGWRPADVAARWPQPAFILENSTIFAPPATRQALLFATVQFGVLLHGVGGFLWFAHRLPITGLLLFFGGLVVGLWLVGAVLQGRLTVKAALGWDAAMLLIAGFDFFHIRYFSFDAALRSFAN